MSRELHLGDLRFVDDESLGFSVYHADKPDSLICWVNLRGERKLLTWINEKPTQQREMPPMGDVTPRQMYPPPAGEKVD